MQLSQIDLNLFKVFDAIYREGGITPASKQLHLSQPAVSHALARLRELLGDPLFERHGNEMTPTPRARELAGDINQLLSGLTRTLSGAAHFDPATAQRRFTIAMRESHERTFLPGMMTLLNRQSPGISVATVRIERRDLEDDLQSGELDLAVDMPLPVTDEIRRQRVKSESLIVLARKDHPTAHASLDLATYLAAEHVLVTGRRHGGGHVDAALQRLNIARHIKVRCQDYGAANAVVASTDLLVTMPRSYAEHVNSCGNQMLPLPTDAPLMEVFMYWHVNVDAHPAHRWLRELALQYL
ncbi:MAG TPA: LysR family transcriptional regulator [Steroidobacteraceae bacterium]|nr:LysR family transcriptional regulator [Steroidobacteraceae bacterium]